MNVLDALSHSAGRKFLIGSVWMSMLRSPKCRRYIYIIYIIIVHH